VSAQEGADRRQAALIVALDEAVGGALRRNGLPLLGPGSRGEPVHNAIRAALVDGLGVLIREFGPRPDDPPLVRQGVGAGWPQVQGRCPACGGKSLFLAAEGHVTCSRLDCGNPCAADDMLSGDSLAAALRDVVRLLDGPQSERAQEAQDVAKAALQRLAGESA
jgi:hypothetical protein